MNEAIVEKWNKLVKPDDIVYHLGDIALNDMNEAIKSIKKLNGKIHIILIVFQFFKKFTSFFMIIVTANRKITGTGDRNLKRTIRVFNARDLVLIRIQGYFLNAPVQFVQFCS